MDHTGVLPKFMLLPRGRLPRASPGRFFPRQVRRPRAAARVAIHARLSSALGRRDQIAIKML